MHLFGTGWGHARVRILGSVEATRNKSFERAADHLALARVRVRSDSDSTRRLGMRHRDRAAAHHRRCG